MEYTLKDRRYSGALGSFGGDMHALVCGTDRAEREVAISNDVIGRSRTCFLDEFFNVTSSDTVTRSIWPQYLLGASTDSTANETDSAV
jgi:hypothetical protein